MPDILDLLAREWPLIANAPVLAIGGSLILLMAGWSVGWKLKGAIDDGEVRAANARMELAADRERDVREKLDLLQRAFRELRDKVATGASGQELGPVQYKFSSTLNDVVAANTALRQVIEQERQIVELPPIKERESVPRRWPWDFKG
jgi:hypothetical protein